MLDLYAAQIALYLIVAGAILSVLGLTGMIVSAKSGNRTVYFLSAGAFTFGLLCFFGVVYLWVRPYIRTAWR